MPNYARYNKNADWKTWPVGTKKPNDWGFFDVQGNVNAWCQETMQSYSVQDDTEDVLEIDPKRTRGLRGGAFDMPASVLRSAYRSDSPAPTVNRARYGIRPARTLPL